jgi:hypothetical protein
LVPDGVDEAPVRFHFVAVDGFDFPWELELPPDLVDPCESRMQTEVFVDERLRECMFQVKFHMKFLADIVDLEGHELYDVLYFSECVFVPGRL